MSRTPFLAALAAAAALVAAAPAMAAPSLTPKRCERGLAKGTVCSTLTVPLDRSGATPGTLDLPVRVQAAGGRQPKRGPLVLLAGGPGQAGIADAGYNAFLASVAPGYDNVSFDQRGTGGTALRCPALAGTDTDAADADGSPAQVTRRFAACAGELGPSRRFYTSADSAADIEDLRIALGAEKLTIGGTSYGTWVSQVYARLHPQRVERLVLDSVVGPAGVAGLALSEYAGARRIVVEQCADGACRGITDDPLGDTTALAARLDAEPVRGRVVRPSGRRSTETLGGPQEPGLLSALFYAGDTSPAVRAAFPAAVASALRGDPALLLRLAASGGEGDEEDATEQSVALFAATTCAETVLPWAGTESFDERRASLAARLAATPAGLLGPWGAATAAGGPAVTGCLEWPDSPFGGVPAGPLPDVPALVLNGVVDVRTPLEDARAVAAQLPQSTLVAIPAQGHSVLGQECAQLALRRFLAGRAVAPDACADAPAAPELLPLPPRSLSVLSPRGRSRGALARRSVVAARLALRDAVRSIDLYEDAPRFPGLRGGSAAFAATADAARLTLHGYEYVPGVRVTGRLRVSAPVRGTLRVGGPKAARGTLLVRDGTARGRLGGVRVTLRIQRDAPAR